MSGRRGSDRTSRMLTGQRRRRSERDPGHVMFGTVGWLFADLMLALALAFIVATTVGQPLPPGKPVANPEPTPTTAVTPTPAVTAEPVLELDPVSIKLTINSANLLNGDAGAAQSLRQQVRSDTRIAGRRAGLVLTFGGTNGGRTVERGLSIADRANDVLRGLGTEGFVFRGNVYRSFISFDSPEVLTVDVYLFKV